MEVLITTILAGTLNGSIYAMIGLGFSLLHRSTGLLNLAQGELLMLAALLFYTASSDWGWPLLSAGALAVATAAAVSVLIDLVLVRRMRSPNVLRIAVVTFGVALIIRGLAHIYWGTNLYSLPTFPGVKVTYRVGFERAVFPGQGFYVLGGLILVAVFLYLLETRTRVGWMMRSVGADAAMATTLGIRAPLMILLSFALAGALAGLVGVLTSPLLFMTTAGGTLIGLKGLVASVVGGFDTRLGAIPGGLLLGLLEQFAGVYIGSAFQDIAVFTLLIAVLLYRPQGLVGARV